MRPRRPDSGPAIERILRGSVAFVWLATGLLGAHPGFRTEGMRWLGRLGLGSWPMDLGCLSEIVLGLVLFACPTRTWTALLQTLLVGGFTITLAALDPMLLVHPLGVLSKNLPLLAVVWTAWLVAREGTTARAERVLRAGMAVVWVTEGVFPKLLFQQELEISMLTSLGVGEMATRASIAALGVLQAASGFLAIVLTGRARDGVLWAQLLALLLLPIFVTAVLPGVWVHPFGPLTKNLPLLAGTFILLRRWPPTSS